MTSDLQLSLVPALVAQTVKHLPTMLETWVQSLGREDLLEKEMATHSSIPAWRIPGTEEPGGLLSMGLHTTEATEQQPQRASALTVCVDSFRREDSRGKPALTGIY